MSLNLATKFAPLRQNFALAAEAGFCCAEIFLDEEILQRVASIVDTANDFGFRYALHFPNRNDLAQQSLLQTIELYQQLNCSALVIHGPQYRKYGDFLQKELPSLRMAVENHHQRPSEIDDWAHSSRWLTLDIEHIWKFTLKDASFEEMMHLVTSILDHYVDRIAHVHLPGYLPGFDEHRPMYCSKDFIWKMFDLLDQHAFSGLVVSEVAIEYQNEHELKMDCLLFERWQTVKSEIELNRLR